MKRSRLLLQFMLSTTVFLCAGGLLFAENIPHGGDIIYTKPLKSVLFSHQLHVEERGLGCDMCHPKPFEMSALQAQENADFTMDSLYKGKYCGACHNGMMAFASSSQCARCHIGVKGHDTAMQKIKDNPSAGKAQGPKDAIVLGQGDAAVKFMHDSHTQMFKCGECHTKLFAFKKGQDKITMAGIYAGKHCGACHNGKKASSSSDCAKCHPKTPAPKTDLVYKPEGIGLVKFSHEFHTQAFGCKDCHNKIFSMKKGGKKMTMDAMNAGKQCGACHDGKKATAVTECAKCHAQ